MSGTQEGQLRAGNVSIDSGGGATFSAWSVEPTAPNGCAVVVIQEIFGITKKIRIYCDLFAREGYLALAPDLFWRLEPGVEIPYTEDGIAKARSFLDRFDDAKALDDLSACRRYLAGKGIERIAMVGFCLGGKLGPLSVARGDADAAVAFYGVGLEKHLDTLAAMTRPVQFHFGAKDNHIPQTTVAALEDLARRNPALSVYSYENAGHAFFRQDLKGDDSQLAFERTKALLAKSLLARA